MGIWDAIRRARWMLFAAAVTLSMVYGAAVAGAQGQIAITFDDLPAHSSLPQDTTRLKIAQDVIRALREAGVPATYGFVNGQRFEDEPAGVQGVLEAWRSAGDPPGSHTWSHMDLNKTTLQAWEADLLKDEPVLERYSRPGDDWRWLRFPFLSEGDTPEKRAGARAFLREHGYRIAAVTMSFGDFGWNEPYARCVAKGDAKGDCRSEEELSPGGAGGSSVPAGAGEAGSRGMRYRLCCCCTLARWTPPCCLSC